MKNAPKNLANRQIYWLAQSIGWFLYWLLLSLINIFFYSKDKEKLWLNQLDLTIVLLVGFLTTHFFRHLIRKRNWIQLPVGQIITRIILSAISLPIVVMTAYAAIGLIVGVLTQQDLADFAFLFRIYINFSIIISLWISIYFSVQYFKNYRKLEVQKLRQEAFLKEATLNNLRSQLNPHFIFNSLNSIRALVADEPDKARDSITALSHIFRRTLQLDKTPLVSISDEIQILKDYLKLEKIRYEDRLKFALELDPNVVHLQVPPLMFQTLVENGIKHGIATLKKGGFIQLTISEGKAHLNVIIRNSGQLQASKKTSGYGVKNTKERLRLLFGSEAKFDLYNDSPETVCAHITIPKKPNQ